MADPNYLLGNSVVATIDGVAVYYQDTTLTEAPEVIDMTNGVNKVHEIELGISEDSFNFTAVIPVDAVPDWTSANVTKTASWGAGGGRTVSGNVKLTNIQERGGARGGRIITGTATFTGTRTKS